MATTSKQTASKEATTKKTATKVTAKTTAKQSSSVKTSKTKQKLSRVSSDTARVSKTKTSRVSAYVRPVEKAKVKAKANGKKTVAVTPKNTTKDTMNNATNNNAVSAASGEAVSREAARADGPTTAVLEKKTIERGSREEQTVDSILAGEGATVDEVVAEVMTPQKKRRERRSELAALEWKRYQRTGSPETRRRLLGLYLPLVRSVAGRMAMGFPRSVDIQDLINTGVLGLSEAFKKFDPDRGVKFETYAVPRIRGAILDELRALDWVPRSTRAKARNIDRATVALENDHGRPPTEDELAERLECTAQELMTAVGDVSSATILSLDEVIYRDEENRQVPRIESVEDQSETSVLKQVLKEEMRTFLKVAINNLTEQEKLVIALYYFEELTLKEIGAVMTISESRVSQIHTKGVGKLRGLIQERYEGSAAG